MAINFPTSLDSFTNPSGTQTLDSPDHAGQHSDANDALEALEAKVGISSGTPVANRVLFGDGNGSSKWSGTIDVGTVSTANLIATSGTVSGILLGTVQITGGTVTTALVTSSTINNSVIGTPAVTGGTATNLTLVTPTFASRTRTVAVSPGEFLVETGTASLSIMGNRAVAALYDNETQAVAAQRFLPSDYLSGTILPKIRWATGTAASGTVVLQLQAAYVRSGAAIPSITTYLNHVSTVTVPGTAQVATVTAFNGFTPTAGEALSFRVLRLGGDAQDSAGGSILVYGLEFDYTADL